MVIVVSSTSDTGNTSGDFSTTIPSVITGKPKFQTGQIIFEFDFGSIELTVIGFLRTRSIFRSILASTDINTPTAVKGCIIRLLVIADSNRTRAVFLSKNRNPLITIRLGIQTGSIVGRRNISIEIRNIRTASVPSIGMLRKRRRCNLIMPRITAGSRVTNFSSEFTLTPCTPAITGDVFLRSRDITGVVTNIAAVREPGDTSQIVINSIFFKRA